MKIVSHDAQTGEITEYEMTVEQVEELQQQPKPNGDITE